MAIISSLRRSITFKARWSDRLERVFTNDRALVGVSPAAPVFPFSFSFSFLFLFPFPLHLHFFFQRMPTKFESYKCILLHSFWVGQYRGIFGSRVAVLSLPIFSSRVAVLAQPQGGTILPPSNRILVGPILPPSN